MEKERMRLELEAQNLRREQEVLDRERRGVEERLAQIQNERKEFEARAQAMAARMKDENFTKSLTLYNELKTKQVKEIFVTMPADVVGDFLKAMEPERASKIIGEFKTPDEQKFITGVLEKIRTAGTPSAMGDSTGPATLPARSGQARS
jgi:flagellar motility protein MotE (MotC chaperone)